MEDFVFARKLTQKRPFYLVSSPLLCCPLTKYNSSRQLATFTRLKIFRISKEASDQSTTFSSPAILSNFQRFPAKLVERTPTRTPNKLRPLTA